MATSLELLQEFFRELFQLDLADLDFGLYRLFHLKRDEIKKFITESLPQEVDAAFSEYSTEELRRAREEYDALKASMEEEFGADALLPDGSVKAEVRQQAQGFKSARELVAAYEAAHKKIQAVEVTEGHKAEVFNHLYAFFSRYYEDGDFIPKRRYGSRETYAVPYDGEEVFFHWANRDQYYVKTGETFRDYAFKVADLMGEYRVRFTMVAASIPKDNTKGKTRYFFPRLDQAKWDAESRTFVLPFEYRLPTPEEVETYGTNSKGQAAILETALPKILAAAPDENLRALLKQDQRTGKQIEAGEAELPLLLKRMTHFCRKNTSDFFIHKDLRGFLTRELDFYVKDQVLHAMDVEADWDARRRVIRVFRRLADRVIEFLANIEETEKRLFEKKKFVLETDYLIPIQHVPEAFWPEILTNEAQLAEWRAWGMLTPQADLFNPNGGVNEAFLRENPTLSLHTRHFGRDFTRRLLEALSFDDLDEATDGLLVHSENWQALSFLRLRYRKQVKCVYIDPPFNTGKDEFSYKDGYQHSSWVAMVSDRISMLLELLGPDASFFCSISDHEIARLRICLDELFGEENFIANVEWNATKTVTNTALVSVGHIHNLIYAKDINYFVRNRHHFRLPDPLQGFDNPDNDPRGPWKADPFQVGGVRPNQQYEIRNPNTGKVYRPNPGCSWKNDYETFQRLLSEGRIVFGRTGEGGPQRKRYLFEAEERGRVSKTWWDDIETTADGTRLLQDLFGATVFTNPKPVSLLTRILQLGTFQPDQSVMDFFAGSGTTGHAVINLNREDGGRRKFILVEMGEHFDTVLLPRIAKVMYSPEWQDGKPKRRATPEEAQRTPRLVKIIRLESYEDTLHNLAAAAERVHGGQREQSLRKMVGEEAYLLRYWLDLPLAEAESLLNGLELAHPFAYRLEILTDEGPRHKPVDVVETFNYLYGLRVRRYETWYSPGDGDRLYRVVKASDREGKRRILVLWRDMKDYDPEKERAFLEKKFAKMQAAGETWDEIWINGDSPTPGVSSLDPLFKRLMMGEAA